MAGTTQQPPLLGVVTVSLVIQREWERHRKEAGEGEGPEI